MLGWHHIHLLFFHFFFFFEKKEQPTAFVYVNTNRLKWVKIKFAKFLGKWMCRQPSAIFIIRSSFYGNFISHCEHILFAHSMHSLHKLCPIVSQHLKISSNKQYIEQFRTNNYDDSWRFCPLYLKYGISCVAPHFFWSF